MKRGLLAWASALFIAGVAVFVPARLYSEAASHCVCQSSCLFNSCFCSATGPGIVHCNCGCTWYGGARCGCSEPPKAS